MSNYSLSSNVKIVGHVMLRFVVALRKTNPKTKLPKRKMTSAEFWLLTIALPFILMTMFTVVVLLVMSI